MSRGSVQPGQDQLSPRKRKLLQMLLAERRKRRAQPSAASRPISVPYSPWLSCPQPRREAAVRLICLPHAGGGASIFHRWHTQLPAHIEVCAVNLPGREARLREPPLTTMSALVSELRAGLLPLLDERPFALFGHSMGALVSFELTLALRRHGAPMPTHLFLASYAAPHMHDHEVDWPTVESMLTVETLSQRLHCDRATAAELLQVTRPAIEADVALCSDYRHVPEAPLSCPITAFRGDTDFVDEAHLVGWRAQTTGAFQAHVEPGDHYSMLHRQKEICATVANALSATVRRDL
ncbi:MAG: alpha/beta fold hydrolase [Myxococcota bacterium]